MEVVAQSQKGFLEADVPSGHRFAWEGLIQVDITLNPRRSHALMVNDSSFSFILRQSWVGAFSFVDLSK